MNVCVCVCALFVLCVYNCVCLCVPVNLSMHVWMSASMHICLHACKYCMQVCMHVSRGKGGGTQTQGDRDQINYVGVYVVGTMKRSPSSKTRSAKHRTSIRCVRV